MKNLIVFFISLTIVSCKVSQYNGDAAPISHTIWDSLLMKHVTEEGLVDYRGFIRDSVRLNQYLALLSQHHPNDKYWTDDEKLAYWINLYNANTVKLVADNYPVESIKDIKPGISFVNSVWDIKFIDVETRTYDLNNIEHGIIRKHFDEPRIHFAVNCAAISCPKLQQRAYTAENLDNQLKNATYEFLGDSSKNKITEDKVQVSSIFKWYNGDFTENGSLVDYLNQYTSVNISKEATIEYMDYDWALNDVD